MWGSLGPAPGLAEVEAEGEDLGVVALPLAHREPEVELQRDRLGRDLVFPWINVGPAGGDDLARWGAGAARADAAHLVR